MTLKSRVGFLFPVLYDYDYIRMKAVPGNKRLFISYAVLHRTGRNA
jgi:hypothetical protein